MAPSRSKREAFQIMHTAIDEGINFFDNCWDYHEGGSEEIMGKGLAADGGKWRKKIFLMTKVCSREGERSPQTNRRQPAPAAN